MIRSRHVLISIFAVMAALASIGTRTTAQTVTFTIVNNCNQTVYPAIYPAVYQNGGWTMTPNTTVSFPVSSTFNGRFWGRKNCNTSTSPYQCDTGSCGGTGAQCASTTGQPTTALMEFNLDALGVDWYDVSYVDAYDFPVGITMSNGKGIDLTCTGDVLAACPSALQIHNASGQLISCTNPCSVYNTATVCGTGLTPQGCRDSVNQWPASAQQYVNAIHNDCGEDYTYPYDDWWGLHTVTAGSTVWTMTFCPNNVQPGVGSTADNWPLAPTNIGGSSSNGTVTVTWAGVSGATSYNIYRNVNNGGSNGTKEDAPLASNLTGTSYTDSNGLVNGTVYYYIVTAWNSAGFSAPSAQLTITANGSSSGGGGGTGTEGPYGGTPGAVPGTIQAENYDTGGQGVGYSVSSVNGSANSYRSDGVDLEATTDTGGGDDLGWTAAGQWTRYTVNVATAGTYTVSFRVASPTAITDGFHLSNASGTNLSGNVNVPATGGYQTWTTVTASVTLPAGQQVLTVNQDAAGWNFNWLSFASTGGGGGGTSGLVDINCGGAATGSWIADNDFVGGTADVVANTISTTAVTNPAPQAVYQSNRYGAITYTIGGLTAGTSYTVRLHFAETYWTAAGDREFNVSINGTQVLTDFDIFKTAGGENIANIQQFTVPANSSGQIVITSANVVDNAQFNGIEIDSTSGGGGLAPAAPTGLTATSGNAQITLAWTASSGATSYSVYRAGSSGSEGGTPIATGITTTSYTNTGLTNGTAYFYKVAAVNAIGTSAQSNEASATPSAPASGEGPYGGTPAAIPGTVQAENYDTGGQGVGYNVTSTNGTANSYRSDGIDLEACTDTGGGYEVGWSAAGQWFRYTVKVATAGTYTVTFRVANGSTGNATFHLQNSSGTNLTGTVTVPVTGGWQTWANVTATVTLPAGQQVLTVSQDSAGFNLNYASFTSSGGGGSGSPVIQIDCGGAAAGAWVADTDFAGGTAVTTTNTIDTTAVTNPAPMAVYQSNRYNAPTYTIGGLTAGTSYTVRLHFAETYWTAAGKRKFNVSINGTNVLTNFDIFATAGAINKANIQQFTATANGSGQIVITTVNVVDNAQINGIEVTH